jgi:hypothetical protein
VVLLCGNIKISKIWGLGSCSLLRLFSRPLGINLVHIPDCGPITHLASCAPGGLSLFPFLTKVLRRLLSALAPFKHVSWKPVYSKAVRIVVIVIVVGFILGFLGWWRNCTAF